MSDTLPLLRLLAGQLRQGMSEDDRHRWALVVDGIADGMMPKPSMEDLLQRHDYWLREQHKHDPDRKEWTA